MKSILVGWVLLILSLVGIFAFVPSVFAEDYVEVTMTKGSSASQACVAAGNCFDPAQLSITPGIEVEWTNADTASHTVTSGKPTDNETGTVFDSGLVKVGGNFKFTFNNSGTYYYYCQVHPWMTGQVIVGNSGSVTTGNMKIIPMNGTMMIQGTMTMMQGMSVDGSTQVTINTMPAGPSSGKPMTIALTFKDANGNLIQHQNYAITVIQDGNSVLSNVTGHTHTGNDVQMIDNLASSTPLDIKVTLNGVGLPGTDPATWKGPQGEIVNFHVVPEFGSMASIVLLIAIFSIVAFTTKTRIASKL